MAIARMTTRMAATLPCALAIMARLTAVGAMTRGLVGLCLGLPGFLAQLVERLQVALAHTVDKTLERHIGDAHQAEMAVLTIQQATGDRLIEVLEPVHADNRRLVQRLLEELGIGRTAILLPHQLGHAPRTGRDPWNRS